MRKLIINADDFALTYACSKGIVELFELGALTSTTILVTSSAFEQCAELARQSRINIGLHLCLTYGRPVAPVQQVSSLVGANGMFKPIDVLQREKVDASQVEIEWRAQLVRLEQAGLRPDHLDSHHYVHECLGEEVLAVALKIANEHGIPMRNGAHEYTSFYHEHGVKTPELFCREFYGEDATSVQLEEILSRPWQGVLELMCHPGHVDPSIEAISSYTKGRQREFDILSSPHLLEYIKREKIILLSFADL